MDMSIDLTAIRARCNAATKGPWYIRYQFNLFSGERFVAGCGGHESNKRESVHRENIPNAEFIAHARTDLPALLDLVEEFKTTLRGYMDAMDYGVEADDQVEAYDKACALLVKCAEEKK